MIIMLGTNDLKSRFSVTPFDIGASMENLVKTIIKSDAGVDFQPPKNFAGNTSSHSQCRTGNGSGSDDSGYGK